jgi:eukaryotic-like serine/threonine-protein kinase
MPPHRAPLAGRYRLDTVLGDGGMGRVWEGYDETLGRPVAVKEVRFPRDITEQEQHSLSERTMREARLTAQLNHPAVVTTYDAVVEDDRPFIVMELVPSVSLAEHLTRNGPLAPDQAAEIALPVLDALATAHSHGIVHRDVKPSNVLLADDGRVMLSDFGIATHESDPSLTTTGILVGSPAFMSPERLRGERSGPPADVWSLGATLYTALEGHPPFRAETTMGTITKIVSDDVPPPRAGGAVADAALGMLVKDPARRLRLDQVRTLLLRETEVPAEPEPDTDPQRTTSFAVPPGLLATQGDEGASEAPATEPEPVVEPEPEPVVEPEPEPVARVEPLTPPGPVTDTEPEPVRRPEPVTDTEPEPVRRPEPATAAPAATGRRPRRLPVLAVVALVVLAGLAAAAFMVLDDPGTTDEAGGVPSGAPSSAPRSGQQGQPGDGAAGGPNPESSPASNVPARAAPEGFHMHQDPRGFQVAIPDGWERELDGPRVDFVAPDGSRFVRIDQRANALPSAERAWLQAEDSVSETLPGYRRIRIEPVPHPTWDVADWEFTWEGDSGTVHVIDRGIATDTRGFALYVSAPHDTWTTQGRPVFDVVSATFRPVE